MYQLLKEQLAATIEALKVTEFNRGNAIERLIMALYATIIEQIDSAVTLIDSSRAAGVEAILRTCLEAHVDLLNLASDPVYADQMQAHYHHQFKLVCQEAMKGTNPFLAGIESDAPARYEEHKRELARLGRPLTIQTRFEMAGLNDLYYSIYNSLCCESHNNMRSLMGRHFINNGTEDTPLFQIAIFNGMEKVDFDAAIDGFLSILTGSNRTIHHYFDSGQLDRLEIFAERRAAMSPKEEQTVPKAPPEA
ncbi:hypothetical protein FJ546_19365 [Mesorhizobium sp. B2-4-19]|uniref:DUF5677 domain-containing protein n=1 Tax=Mesorhizobium sp. B2-4-19 TaxID=2589930 RepID=UPI00112E73AF|nr:DUF5677 domain-containing protein [Mesorhizobium sp. B2-4-19]TPK60533.1 hypothetical protein FJ546_19365 [Mesorhizobium sp. B2-4-19]